MNRGYDYAAMMAGLASGIERAILQILTQRIGLEHAISRDLLVATVNNGGLSASEREVRAVINALRKQGCPICSTGGIGGGYWLARDWRELDEYLDQEVRARLADLREQELALEKAGQRLFGPRQFELAI